LKSEPSPKLPRGAKQICVPMDKALYDEIWHDPHLTRKFIEDLLVSHPDLFPPGTENGFAFHGRPAESRKLPGIRLRQFRLKSGKTFTLRPSFVMPYMAGFTENVKKGLLLLSHNVPVWLVTEVLGQNDMFWQRQLERLGRNSVVGTTVRDQDRLPKHLAADEHHVQWCDQKGFAAMTAGGGCVLGVGLTDMADELHLQAAYGDFQREALNVNPEYKPLTVNTDGWPATQNAFLALFNTITVILCFLHGFLKVRDRCRKAFDLHKQIWDVYRAETAAEFRKRMQQLSEWVQSGTWPTAVRETVAKLQNRVEEYAVAYAHPGCHRTSNAVDRPMNALHRLLYASRGMHGHQPTSERRLRGAALLYNFRPFAHRSGEKRIYTSPAHRLNRKQYHDDWLQNLLISASLGGYRHHT